MLYSHHRIIFMSTYLIVSLFFLCKYPVTWGCQSIINKYFFKKIVFQMKIEQVLGLTVPSNAALHSNPVSGTIAYPAG